MKRNLLIIIILIFGTNISAQNVAFNIEAIYGYSFQQSFGEDIKGFSFKPALGLNFRIGFQYQVKKAGVNASLFIPSTGNNYIINIKDSTSYSHSNRSYNLAYRLDFNYLLCSKKMYEIKAGLGFYYAKESYPGFTIISTSTHKTFKISNINYDPPFQLFCPLINFQFLKSFKKGNKLGVTIEGRYNGAAFDKRTRNYNVLTFAYLNGSSTKSKRLWSNENSINMGIVYFFKPFWMKHSGKSRIRL